MEKRLLIAFVCLLLSLSGFAQTTAIYSENFNGSNPTFALNTSDVMSNPNGYNDWVINNAYTGGSTTILCLGFPFAITVPNTPAQPAAINGFPNSNYLHILADDGATANINNANYRPADGLCVFPENNFAAMNTDINTTGLTNVNLSFYWMHGGLAGSTYGEVFYSTNGGTSWTLITAPISQYFNQPTWTQQNISLPAFDNQTTLRFGFRFFNNTASAGSEPSFSIDEIVVTAQPGCANTTGSATAAICDGDSILLGGAFQTTSGAYVDNLVNAAGCDSILTTTLSVNANSTMNMNSAICDGDSIFLGGAFQSTPGTYTDVFANAQGCDSTVITTLTVNPSFTSTATASICDGDSILLAGAFQTTAGVYTDAFSTALGCDSSIVTTLTVFPSYSENATASICAGDSILLGGAFQTTAGTYVDQFSSVDGCDSTITTTLSVTNPDTSVSVIGQLLISAETGATYQWFDCSTSTPVAGATSQDFVPSVSGEYAVILDVNGCIDTSACVFVFIVGTEEALELAQTKVFPNPVVDQLDIQLNRYFSDLEVYLFDAAGRIVYQ